MVNLLNFWHFFFILFGVGVVVGLYFILKNKRDKVKKIVLGSLLAFNLALHFLKLLFPPYSEDMVFALKNIWFINVCATSVLFFPFIFISKSKVAKDYMVYLGVISGFLALLYPTEAIGKSLLTFDLWRFYICHIIIFAVPLLTVLLGLHKLDVKRIIKFPFCVAAMLLFIICNQVLQSELGFISLRDSDIFDINWHNPSLIWGPTDGVAVIFSWLTPDFMKTIPIGEYAGQPKYWPFFWMLPGVFFYFLIEALAMCFIFEFRNTVEAFKLACLQVTRFFKWIFKSKRKNKYLKEQQNEKN